jgi:TolA-binding protein
MKLTLRHAVETRRLRRGVIAAIIAVSVFGGVSGCVYFNTMYNARKHFRNAEKQNDPTRGGKKMATNRRLYEDAIEKAAKIVRKHHKSKYHDDALFMIGVSYFRIDNYSKSESAFRELLAVHPKSEFAEESHLYLARCRMQLGDEQAGYRTFTELAASARKPEWRAEASFQRGLYLAEQAVWDSAAAAYGIILDSFPETPRATEARLNGAEAWRQLDHPDSAMALYQPLANDDDLLIRYQALLGLGRSCYDAGLIDSGIAIFSAMSDDEDYGDSVGNVRLLLAEGLRARKDQSTAWRQYEQVAATLEKTRWSAEAYFRMAEIKQYEEDDLVSAREYYELSRQENANSALANEALTRSANIGKLAEFRKALGRAELVKGAGGRAATAYDPENLPRLERDLPFSPPEARPVDFVPRALRDAAAADSLAVDSTAFVGPPTPEELKNPWDSLWSPLRHGPPTPPEFAGAAVASSAVATEPYGPSTDLAPLYGPPVDSAQLVRNARESELLPFAIWRRIIGTDSIPGPPSPARLYEFGFGDLQGPETPADSLLWASIADSVINIDSTAIREREQRTAARTQRREEFAAVAKEATTQLQLAELYRFDLSYPDSALVEYDDIVLHYPETPFAAQAMLAAADLCLHELNDSAQAKERLAVLLQEHPYSDYASDAIAWLGWEGQPADTAHPAKAYAAAESRYLDDGDPKRAISLFREFIVHYPHSRLVPRAEYAVATLTDRHFSQGDSSLVWAYQELAVAYPQSDVAVAASARLTPVTVRPKPRQAPVPKKDEAEKGEKGTPGGGKDQDSSVAVRLPRAPRPKFAPAPVFPSADVGVITKEVIVVYRILIDYAGKISEHELIQKSPSLDLDEATRRALLQTYFNPDSIAAESLNMWYQYEIRITPQALDINDPMSPNYRGPQ